MENLINWLVAAMVAWVPPGKSKWTKETEEETLARYREIATDAAIIAFNPEIKPLYPGKHGRHKTALQLLSIAFWESSFSPSVDNGYSRGDDGQSYCLMQIKLGNGKVKFQIKGQGEVSWSGWDLVKDRKKCFYTGLEYARRSFGACRKLPVEHRLTAYAAGVCGSFHGMVKSKQRVRKALSEFARRKPEETDADVLESYCETFSPFCGDRVIQVAADR